MGKIRHARLWRAGKTKMKRFIQASPVIGFLFLLTYLPGVTRGTITFHLEDAALLAALVWRAAKPQNLSVLIQNLKSPAIRWFLVFHLGFVVWTNIVNFIYADSLSEVLYSVTLFRSVAFSLWLLSFGDLIDVLRTTVRFLPAMGLLQQAVVLAQSYNLYGINERLTPLYSTVVENSIYSLLGLRSDGTYANPNDASIAISFFATASLACWYFERRSLRANLYYLGSAMTGLYSCVVFCKSRTGTASLIFSLLAFGTLALFTYKKKHILGLTLWALIALLGVGIGQVASDVKLHERFSVFTGETRLTDEGSFAERLVMWQDGLALVWQHLETGLGVSALVQYGWLDGGYTTYIFISGIVGLMLILASFAPPLIQVVREHSSDRIPLAIATLQVMLVTISHPMAMKDKLWLLFLTVFFYLAMERRDAEQTIQQAGMPNNISEPVPQPNPA
jgi:hypothetical protein